MKVVKYKMKVKVKANGKETIFEKTFRHLVNARKFIKELIKDEDVNCTQLNSNGDIFTKECTGEKVSYFFEIKRVRITKPKKEEKKQQKKEETPKAEGTKTEANKPAT